MNEYSQALDYIMIEAKETLNYEKQISTLRRLVDKSEVLEPLIYKSRFFGETLYACRNCGSLVDYEDEHFNYCGNCGQRIR